MCEDTFHIKDEWIMDKIHNDKLDVEKVLGFPISENNRLYFITFFFFTFSFISQFHWLFYRTSLNCIMKSLLERVVESQKAKATHISSPTKQSYDFLLL